MTHKIIKNTAPPIFDSKLTKNSNIPQDFPTRTVKCSISH